MKFVFDKKRLIAVRPWIFVLQFLNMVYNLLYHVGEGVLGVDTKDWVPVCFWIMFGVVWILLIISYRSDIRAIYPALIIISARNVMPMIFESTKSAKL